MALDSKGNIYVAADQNRYLNLGQGLVLVYAAGSNGDVPPIAVIGGNKTGLQAPTGIALDRSDNIYVTNNDHYDRVNTIVEFKSGSNGNVTPIAIIAGNNAGLRRPASIAIQP